MNKQKHDDFLKKIIIIMGIFLLIFTIAMVLLFYFTGGMEPSTLIACVFAACMGEYSVCGFIKIGKTKDIITNLTTCSKILEIAYG